MREKDITPEVIRLSKAIAELWRMKIYVGCWVITLREVVYLIKSESEIEWIEEDHGGIPIPSISDCLEKLKELDSEWRTHQLVAVFDGLLTYDIMTIQIFHEALLSALLEVLRNNVA